MWSRVTFSILVLAVQLFGQRGQKQFAQTCGFCHGTNATGAEGPNLIRSALVRHDVNGNLIGQVIREGRPAKGMPPIPLNQKQIDDVVAYLHSRVQESDRRSPARPRDYSLKLLLTGNPAAGKQFFAGNCGMCHSTSGDLAHIAIKYEPADLQARFLYPPDTAKTATVTTMSGQQISGPLILEDQFTIAIRNKDGWYRSWPKSEVKVQVSDPLAAHLELLHKYTQANMHDVFAYLETLK
jgi:cytochrome c oxidase cbb3-type subunit III